MAYYNKLDTHKHIQALAEALVSHTPESIKAAGEETRLQLTLTQEQQHKYDDALLAIAQADELRNNIRTSQAALDAKAAEIEETHKQLLAKHKAVDNMVVSLNTREAALNEREAKQADEAARLKVWENSLATSAQEVNKRITAVSKREEAADKVEARLKAALAG